MIKIYCSNEKLRRWVQKSLEYPMFDITSPYLQSLKVSLIDGGETQICLHSETKRSKTDVYFNCGVSIQRGVIYFEPLHIKMVVDKILRASGKGMLTRGWCQSVITDNEPKALQEWRSKFLAVNRDILNAI